VSARVCIGLDLSLTGTGMASSRGWTRLLRPPAKARGHVRLDWIRDAVLEHVGSPHDNLVVVEGPSYGSQAGQSGHHERAGLWWLVTHGLWKRGVDYAVASPKARAKYATGSGNAGKADVVREVTRRFDWFDGAEDEADALVLAAMGADWLGSPMVVLPQTHRKALDAVRWPDGLSAPQDVETAPEVLTDTPVAQNGVQRPPSADAWSMVGDV
jgi:Holliday junction resolvasome RuvABC endonuclease subunit